MNSQRRNALDATPSFLNPHIVAIAMLLATGLAAVQSTQAQTLEVLYSFKGHPDGAYSKAALIRDSSGNLFGTTENGGKYQNGTVFEISASGTETVLYSFQGGQSDGCSPESGLLIDKRGDLYGTTTQCGESDFGTVFKLTKSNGTWTEAWVYSFTETDGGEPTYTSLIMDKKGSLYGVTSAYGANGCGTVYKLSQARILKVLHAFAGGTTDGCHAYGTPYMDRQGDVYGTTYGAGSSTAGGVIWKLGKNNYAILHAFAGGPNDGANPYSGVIMDAKGNLYGTTYNGGTAAAGTVYELEKSGTLKLLVDFDTGDNNSAAPVAGVMMGAAGTLYGDTLECFNGHNAGSIYSWSQSAGYMQLWAFDGSDGAALYGGLIKGKGNQLYGTSYDGGNNGAGDVWELTF